MALSSLLTMWMVAFALHLGPVGLLQLAVGAFDQCHVSPSITCARERQPPQLHMDMDMPKGRFNPMQWQMQRQLGLH
jgi:hypothetical protein